MGIDGHTRKKFRSCTNMRFNKIVKRNNKDKIRTFSHRFKKNTDILRILFNYNMNQVYNVSSSYEVYFFHKENKAEYIAE